MNYADTKAITNPLGWYLPDWSNFELRLVIDFAPFVVRFRKRADVTIRPTFSWKRARKVITIAGKSSIGRTPEADHWAKAAVGQLEDQWRCAGMVEPIPREIEINAAVVNYLPTAAVTDSSNLYQGPEDIMQAHKGGKKPCKPKCRVHACIIVDDAQVRTHNGSDRLIDRQRCRVEITLTPYAPGRAMRHPVQEEMIF
jgi:hypothetical protein